MGFLTLTPDAFNFNKVTISFWFHIPAEAITAAEAKFAGSQGFQDWIGVIPLITWGPQSTGTQYTIEGVLLGTEPGIGDIFGTEIGTSWDSPHGPSYIGIACVPMGSANIDVRIQTDNAVVGTNVQEIADDYVLTGGGTTYDLTYSDASSTVEGYSDFFGFRSQTSVSADQWHHILISWDLTGGSASHGGDGVDYDVGFDATSTMFMAYDDANKIEENLPMNWTETGPNSHASDVVATYSGAPTNNVGDPSVVLTVGTIPWSPISIPAPLAIDLARGAQGDTVSDAPVLRVRIAELQIFTDVALDTSVEENRRAFITSAGKPASPALAAALLGKEPEIRFQTPSDWTSGNNRGTAGNFTKVGTISAYTTDPVQL